VAALQDHCPAGSQLVAAPVASTVPGRGAASALVDLGACQFSQFVQSAYHHEANDNAPYRPQFLRMMPCEGVASRGLTLLGDRTSRCRGLTFRLAAPAWISHFPPSPANSGLVASVTDRREDHDDAWHCPLSK
jgi:hypothetical protein